MRFIAEAPDRTRVELEHRNLDRHGDGWEPMRDSIGSGRGWSMLLERFADAAQRSRPRRRDATGAGAGHGLGVPRRQFRVPVLARKDGAHASAAVAVQHLHGRAVGIAGASRPHQYPARHRRSRLSRSAS